MQIALTIQELAELDRQNPATKDNGGFQDLLVTLQPKVDRQTNTITLDHRDAARIARYAFDYRNGGWQKRLLHIFQRALGPSLGRPTGKAA
jgi:hypothetical protein